MKIVAEKEETIEGALNGLDIERQVFFQKLTEVAADIKAVEASFVKNMIIKAYELENDEILMKWDPALKRIVVEQEDGAFRAAIECKVDLRLTAHKYLVELIKKVRESVRNDN